MATTTDQREGSGGELTRGAVERLLADTYRRVVVSHLRKTGTATEVELVDAVGHAVCDGWMTDHDRVRIVVDLRIDHLPELAEAGLITRDGDEVSLAHLSPAIHGWLDDATET